MNGEKSNSPALFIDNERCDWDDDIITLAQIRKLAFTTGSIGTTVAPPNMGEKY